jgi:hypothetical protein
MLHQATTNKLECHIKANPASSGGVNLMLLDNVKATLTELKSLAVKHQKSNMLKQFALARKTQFLLDRATKSFTDAISQLHLDVAVSQYGVNLHIDENVSVLVR